MKPWAVQSGPLLDRIDIHLAIPLLTRYELLGQDWGEELGGRPAAGPGRAGAAACRRAQSV